MRPVQVEDCDRLSDLMNEIASLIHFCVARAAQLINDFEMRGSSGEGQNKYLRFHC